MTVLPHTIKRRFGLSLTVAVISFALLDCGTSVPPYDDSTPEPPAIVNAKALPPPSQLSCSSGTAGTYAAFGANFLLKYCSACHSAAMTGEARHGAPEAAVFDSAESAQIWRGAILDRISSGKMPPAGGVEPTDLATTKEWLGCGAPRR